MSTPASLEDLFPPFALRITADDLTMRLMRDSDLPEYAALLHEPVFDPAFEHACFAWLGEDLAATAKSAVQFQWAQRAAIGGDDYEIPFGVWWKGRLVGSQGLRLKEFASLRTVDSGSWLTRSAHGQGIGTLMRQAILVFAFDHLGAERAESAPEDGNLPSLAVSKRLGYRPNGAAVVMEGGRRRLHHHMVLTPDDFVRPEVELQVEGFTPELRRMLTGE